MKPNRLMFVLPLVLLALLVLWNSRPKHRSPTVGSNQVVVSADGKISAPPRNDMSVVAVQNTTNAKVK